MSSTGFDSVHETRWGGACPGNIPVDCTDDPNDEVHVWSNDQTSAQPVYFLVDAFYASGAGEFTLSWEIIGPPALADATGGLWGPDLALTTVAPAGSGMTDHSIRTRIESLAVLGGGTRSVIYGKSRPLILFCALTCNSACFKTTWERFYIDEARGLVPTLLFN